MWPNCALAVRHILRIRIDKKLRNKRAIMQYLGSPEKGEPITGSPTPIAMDESVTISSIPSCLLSIVGSQNLATTGNVRCCVEE